MIVFDGLPEFFQVERLVDRHDFVAFGVVGRVQRDRQLHPEVEIGELPDLFG